MLLLLACAPAGPPAELSGCDDFDCRKAWVVARRDDADAALRAIAAVPDAVEGEALVNALAAAGGRWGRDACEPLRGSPAARCRQTADRPHLRKVDGGRRTAQACLASAPETPVRSPWEGVAAAEVTCEAGRGEVECRTTRAVELARAGRVDDAAATCAGLAEEGWRHDCAFQASEVTARRDAPGARGDAARLCLATGPFVAKCLGHLASAIGEHAPAVSAGTAAWLRRRREVEEVRAALSGTPELAAGATSRIWATVLARAYLDAPAVTGDPLDVTGPEALPHARSAAAVRLLERGELDGMGLAEAAATVNARLATRGSRAGEPGRPRAGATRTGVGTLLPGEEVVPIDCWLGPGKRAVDPDPAIDATLAVVEALDGVWTAEATRLLREAARHEAWVVRWTAARVFPEGRRDTKEAAFRGESHPLVKGRI